MEIQGFCKLNNFLIGGIGLFLVYCQTMEPTKGPYFGNGIKNGWADQNSIVVWTRLTQNKLANFNGRPFLEASSRILHSSAMWLSLVISYLVL